MAARRPLSIFTRVFDPQEPYARLSKEVFTVRLFPTHIT
jgi:hypothetical protein